MTTDSPTILSKEQVLDALRPVQEPEVGRSIVDLGMVPNVAIDGSNVRVQIELMTPAYGRRESLEAEVRSALATIPDLGQVEIAWSARVRPSGGGRSDAEP